MIDQARADRIRGDARVAGRNDVADCQECQEKAERYLDGIQSQAALIRRLDASLDRWREACAENKRRARKWKRLAKQANVLPYVRERDEARAEAERLQARITEMNADRPAQIARLMGERDEARAEARSWIRHFDEAREANEPLRKELDAERTITRNYSAQVQDLHDRLDAMTARARGMREECMRQSEDEYHAGGYRVAANLVRIAGEPIP